MPQVDRQALAEQKFRPLKKRMQQTFKRLRQAVRAGIMPDGRVVDEFVEQARLMVSYPGFGDAAYPQLLTASDRLATCHAQADMEQFREALATLDALQARCHTALEQG